MTEEESIANAAYKMRAQASVCVLVMVGVSLAVTVFVDPWAALGGWFAWVGYYAGRWHGLATASLLLIGKKAP